MKYYPARLRMSFKTAADALRSAGFSEDRILAITTNAKTDHRGLIFSHQFMDRGLVIAELENGKVGLWDAWPTCTSSSPDEALRSAKKVEAALKGYGKATTWTVFEWQEPVHTATH